LQEALDSALNLIRSKKLATRDDATLVIVDTQAIQ